MKVQYSVCWAAKYVGSFLVADCADSENKLAQLRSQLQELRATSGPCKPVLLVVSLAGLKVCSTDGKEVYMAHALKRISYATSDPDLKQFAFLAREPRAVISVPSRPRQQCPSVTSIEQYCHAFAMDSAEQTLEINKMVAEAFQAALLRKCAEEKSSFCTAELNNNKLEPERMDGSPGRDLVIPTNGHDGHNSQRHYNNREEDSPTNGFVDRCLSEIDSIPTMDSMSHSPSPKFHAAPPRMGIGHHHAYSTTTSSGSCADSEHSITLQTSPAPPKPPPRFCSQVAMRPKAAGGGGNGRPDGRKRLSLPPERLLSGEKSAFSRYERTPERPKLVAAPAGESGYREAVSAREESRYRDAANDSYREAVGAEFGANLAAKRDLSAFGHDEDDLRHQQRRFQPISEEMIYASPMMNSTPVKRPQPAGKLTTTTLDDGTEMRLENGMIRFRRPGEISPAGSHGSAGTPGGLSRSGIPKMGVQGKRRPVSMLVNANQYNSRESLGSKGSSSAYYGAYGGSVVSNGGGLRREQTTSEDSIPLDPPNTTNESEQLLLQTSAGGAGSACRAQNGVGQFKKPTGRPPTKAIFKRLLSFGSTSKLTSGSSKMAAAEAPNLSMGNLRISESVRLRGKDAGGGKKGPSAGRRPISEMFSPSSGKQPTDGDFEAAVFSRSALSGSGSGSERSRRTSLGPLNLSVGKMLGKKYKSKEAKLESLEESPTSRPSLPFERDEIVLPVPETEDAFLSEAPWFCANMPREAIVPLLMHEPPGTFLVRRSTTQPGCYALSLRVPPDSHSTTGAAGLSNFLIYRNYRGYKLRGFPKEFPSVHSLITHHTILAEKLPCRLQFSRGVAQWIHDYRNAEAEHYSMQQAERDMHYQQPQHHHHGADGHHDHHQYFDNLTIPIGGGGNEAQKDIGKRRLEDLHAAEANIYGVVGAD